jgi:hypothetical protein
MLGAGLCDPGGEDLGQWVGLGGGARVDGAPQFAVFGVSVNSRPPISTTLRSTVMIRAAWSIWAMVRAASSPTAARCRRRG